MLHTCDYTETCQAKQLDERIDRYHRINRDVERLPGPMQPEESAMGHEKVLVLWAFAFRECCFRIVKAVEKLRRADDLSQEMPIEVCLQR